ncbi:hypothetical protein ABIB62_004607 [Mucilaginibacter sp. UYP25]|uniref:DUF1223 domain-containing protein n=1 Tax=unclassified Mucilaginibacter TaxID=2617802 RepID=UPI0033970C4F
MKPFKLIFVCAGVGLMLFIVAFVNRPAATIKKNHGVAGARGFALLELFTSEGCSSCTAADDLLAQIQKESPNEPVYVLAYHVDYWDRLGWKDTFSDSDFTKRQYAYSNWLGAQVYTPQVVINGKTECVGSDEAVLRKRINYELALAPVEVIDLKASLKNGSLSVSYQITGKPGDVQLQIAIVQKNAISKVARGENSGRTLSHAQIVRKIYPVSLKERLSGTAVLKAPQRFNAQDWEVIGFLQNTKMGKIIAAAKAGLSNAATTL